MNSISREMIINTLRFLSQDNHECDKCPMQYGSTDVECGDNGCEKLIMKKAAQMLEDDGLIMKAWCCCGKQVI